MTAWPLRAGLAHVPRVLTVPGMPAGQILEKLNGITSDKRMADRHFGDISYVQDMAWQVLTALDQAQRTLGGPQAGRLPLHSCCSVWQQNAPESLARMLEASCHRPRRLLCQRRALPCHWLPRSKDGRADCWYHRMPVRGVLCQHTSAVMQNNLQQRIDCTAEEHDLRRSAEWCRLQALGPPDIKHHGAHCD